MLQRMSAVACLLDITLLLLEPAELLSLALCLLLQIEYILLSDVCNKCTVSTQALGAM